MTQKFFHSFMTVFLCSNSLLYLNSCKSLQSELSEEIDFNDPKLDPQVRRALGRLNQKFELGVTHTNDDGCTRTWLRRMFDERYGGTDGKSNEGLNLWNLTRVAHTNIDSSAKIKKMFVEIEFGLFTVKQQFQYIDDNFMKEHRDFDNRLVLNYELDVVTFPNLVRNFIILAKNMSYFQHNTRKYEQSVASGITATLQRLDQVKGEKEKRAMIAEIVRNNPDLVVGCRDQVKLKLNRDSFAYIRSNRGVGDGSDPRRMEYIYEELIRKLKVRVLGLELLSLQASESEQDTDKVVQLPFLGSLPGTDPFHIQIENKSPKLNKGDLVQIMNPNLNRVMATKVGFYPFESGSSWPKSVGFQPVRIGKLLIDSQADIVDELVRSQKKFKKEKEDNEAMIIKGIAKAKSSGQEITPQQERSYRANRRSFREIVIKSITFSESGSQNVFYTGEHLPRIK